MGGYASVREGMIGYGGKKEHGRVWEGKGRYVRGTEG